MTHNYKTWVEVSKQALQNNAQIIHGLLASGTKLLAVVKSNAYGHGLIETARILCAQTDWFGVDNIDEAILLRDNGIKMPILIMGFTPPERIAEASKHDFRLTVYNYLPNPAAFTKFPPLHLKIDTGMSRQGILVSELPEFLKSLPRNANIEGVFTHFADADNLEDRRYTEFQLANFKHALEILEKHKIKPEIIHASATTGLLTMPEQFNMVRLGVALYGLWPSVKFEKKFKDLNLKPALSWKTRIVQIKRIKTNTPVGYGITEKVKKDTVIAILPVGYYEGYGRVLSSVGHVLVAGRRCKVLGRISMNLTIVDISCVPTAKVWDEAVLIGSQSGEQISAEELAEKMGTISYEVITRINPLLPRVYI